MTQFRDRQWSDRFLVLGDEAEAVFDEWHPVKSAPLGLNRPDVPLGNVPAFLRYMPDRLLADGLVECQGIGRDQTVKLKLDKFLALKLWHNIFPTRMFVWDSANRRCGFLALDEIEALIAAGKVEWRRFPEGKAYIAIDAEYVEWEGTHA